MPRLSGELIPGRSPIKTTTMHAPGRSPIEDYGEGARRQSSPKRSAFHSGEIFCRRRMHGAGAGRAHLSCRTGKNKIMLLASVVETSRRIADTSKRLE